MKNVQAKDSRLFEECKEIPLSLIQDVLIRLAQEGVSIFELTTVLQVLWKESRGKSPVVGDLVELSRQALSRQLCQQLSCPDGRLAYFRVDREIESMINEGRGGQPGQARADTPAGYS